MKISILYRFKNEVQNFDLNRPWAKTARVLSSLLRKEAQTPVPLQTHCTVNHHGQRIGILLSPDDFKGVGSKGYKKSKSCVFRGLILVLAERCHREREQAHSAIYSKRDGFFGSVGCLHPQNTAQNQPKTSQKTKFRFS